MLTAKDLALIRASLLFFQEENCTGDSSVMQHYFGRNSCRGITTETIRSLRERLHCCQLRFVLVTGDGLQLASDRIYRTAQRAERSGNSSQFIVGSLLIPRSKVRE